MNACRYNLDITCEIKRENILNVFLDVFIIFGLYKGNKRALIEEKLSAYHKPAYQTYAKRLTSLSLVSIFFCFLHFKLPFDILHKISHRHKTVVFFESS